jgi:hypothetical protein
MALEVTRGESALLESGSFGFQLPREGDSGDGGSADERCSGAAGGWWRGPPPGLPSTSGALQHASDLNTLPPTLLRSTYSFCLLSGSSVAALFPLACSLPRSDLKELHIMTKLLQVLHGYEFSLALG